jgi:FG-GAP repeat/PEP-CTERM motif
MKRTNWTRIICISAIVAACSLASPASASTWAEADKLTASDGQAEDQFGRSVSISGDTAIIGAFGDDDNGGNAGAAYIFANDGSGWAQISKLTPTTSDAGDKFGATVSISGNTAVVGARYDADKGDAAGAAYIFQDDGSGWSQAFKLLANDGASSDLFGCSVSISDTTAIVGARLDDDGGTDSGSAYIFEKNGASWSQVAKLTASDGNTSDNFGHSVSISGNAAIVGAYANDDTDSDSGSAYVFENDGSGWAQVAKLTASDAAMQDHFGITVSISNGVAIVGAEDDDDDGSGSGSAYIFSDDGSGWAEVAKLTASDASTNDYFGHSVSISGNTAIVGAIGDDDLADSSGSAYVFQNDGSTWSERGKVVASDGAATDYFGKAVALDGSMIIVGSYFDDDNGNASGSAYIFTASTEPVPEPLSMIFFGTGVVGVLGFVSRRKMQKGS